LDTTLWDAWKNKVSLLKQNTYALYLASRDPRVPWVAKLVVGLVVAYALSPIDLIPDFIPILGYVDDVLLLPLGIALAIKLMPRDVWAECQERARTQIRLKLPSSRIAALMITLIWIAVLVTVAVFSWKWLKHASS
jgi:uncharacterized membrane protein YkvA (DUF1232 family)